MNHQFESNLYLPMRCDVCSKHKFDPFHVEPKLPETFEEWRNKHWYNIDWTNGEIRPVIRMSDVEDAWNAGRVER